MARPRKEFSEKDIDQMKALARCHCPDDEIAAFIGCGESTLKRRYGPVLKEERKAGLANIRAWQYQAAKKGNPTMLIWLGKQLLKQSDKIESSISVTDESAATKQEKLKLMVSEIRAMLEDAKQCQTTPSLLQSSPLPVH